MMDVVCIDDVIVVKDEDDLARRRAELVHERGEDQLDGRRLRLLQERERVSTDIRFHRLQGRDHVGPEGRALAIAWVERQPGRRSPVGGWIVEPLGKKRGLAESGRSGEKRQLGVGPTSQALH